MRQRSGLVVMIGSVVSMLATPFGAAYSGEWEGSDGHAVVSMLATPFGAAYSGGGGQSPPQRGRLRDAARACTAGAALQRGRLPQGMRP